ncbi:MAG TPA: PIN domain-containing protein [Bacteroidia bacterium]|nr:PIN domain-containing protein [Bacteroidia bacterium]
MTKLLIDTCIWWDLAKTANGEKLLSLLEEFIKEEEVSLIIPEIIISEFDRNKERIVRDAAKSLSSHFDKVKEMVVSHGEHKTKTLMVSQLNDLNHKIPTFGESIFGSIQRIEKLFSESEILKTTDEIILRSAKRAIDKKAPFHLSKNSIGDSIIFELYLEYKLRNEAQEFKLMFITHNKDDFSLKNGNQKIPHGDIAGAFDSIKSSYFISLPEALHYINSELIKNIEFENDWHYEPRGLTEMMDMANELEQKIWYNRHQIRAYKIKRGEIKIIDRKDFDVKTSHKTIVKDIWEGAKKSARAVEKKYGKENLSWDDFEWGMLNGKLSAIRWVNGDEWDNLDI